MVVKKWREEKVRLRMDTAVHSIRDACINFESCLNWKVIQPRSSLVLYHNYVSS